MKTSLVKLIVFSLFILISNQLIESKTMKDISIKVESISIQTKIADVIIEIIKNIVNSPGNISKTCIDSLSNLINDTNDSIKYNTTYKIYSLSSKILNNIGGYKNCDLNYSVAQIIINNHSSFDSGKNIIGLCNPFNCNETELATLIKNSSTFIFDYKTNNSNLTINVFDYKQEITAYKDKKLQIVLLYYIPIYIVLLLMIFSCFPGFLGYIFKCCFKTKRTIKISHYKSEKITEKSNSNEIVDLHEESKFHDTILLDGKVESENLSNLDNIYRTQTNREEIIINNQKLSNFMKCFDLNDNVDEVFNSNSSILYNDSGLTFLRGLRGLFMILSLIGLVFSILLDSPLKIYNKKQLNELFLSASMTFFLFCHRTCPLILLSITGFSFTYKFICFLEKRKKNINISDSVNSLNSIKDKIKCKHFFTFIFRFSYKFVIYLLIDLIKKFSMMLIIAFFYPGPMIIYLQKYIIGEIKNGNDVFHYLLRIFLFNYLYNFYTTSEEDSLSEGMDTLWYVRNEIVYISIFSIIFFILYRKSIRIDLFLIIIMIFFIIAKIIYFYITIGTKYEVKSFAIIKYTEHLNLNPLFNIIYFTIGCFYGICNYIIQKSLTEEDISQTDKKYLEITFYFIRFLKGNSKLLKFLLFIILIFVIFNIGFGFFLRILFYYSCTKKKENEQEDYYECCFRIRTNYYLVLFNFLCNELFIFGLFLILMKLIVSQSYIIYTFLRAEVWTLMSRMIFSYSLVGVLMINFVYYQSESRINIDIMNIIFFSIFTFGIVMVMSVISFVMLEVPLKKLNYFFVMKSVSKSTESTIIEVKNK